MNLDNATEHRRDDGERVGWILPAGELWQGIDVLGHEVGEPAEWLDVEALLEDRGIGFLAERWTLEREEGPVRVRIVEISPGGIVVKGEDFGAIDAPLTYYTVAWPAPSQLRLSREDDPSPFFG